MLSSTPAPNEKIRITFRNGIYVALAGYEYREALKAAGFVWHLGKAECRTGPSKCRACKAGLKTAWWTWRSGAAARLSAYADPEATAALAKHIKSVEESRAVESNIQVPCNNGLAYLGYQKAGIAYLNEREGALLGDEPGVGKTIQILGLINLDKTLQNVLVICPATLRINWQREAKKWLVKDERQWVPYIVDSDVAVPEHANLVFIHYNRVSIGYRACKGECGGEKRKTLPCPACKGSGEGRKSNIVCPHCQGRKHVFCKSCNGRGKIPATNLHVIESIKKRKWDLIVADEAHFLKNIDAKRTRAILGDRYNNRAGLADLARKRIFMTGTPIPNRPVEIWPVISVLAPKEFGNFKSFAQRYCGGREEFIGKNKKVFKFDGASNLEELQERLRAHVMLRRLKADVLKDLPSKTRQVIPLVPTPEAKILIAQEMAEWERKFGEEMTLVQAAIDLSAERKDPNGYDQAVEKLKYIQRIAFIEMARVRREVAVVKIPSVIEHLEEMFGEGIPKIVCFAHHREVIEKIQTHFAKEAVAIYGDVKMADRQKAVDQFQDPKSSVKLFVGGIMAAGTGLTLTAASNVVFAELDWTPGVILQCEDRCHRISQKNSVLVQHLVLDGSLDARMAQMIVEKQEIADRALDKTTDVIIKGVLAPRIENPVEAVPLWRKAALKEALIQLAMRRDPTYTDGHGFNAMDATIGQSMATQKGTLSDKQAHIANKLVEKYKRQVPDTLTKQLGLYTPPEIPKPQKQRRTVPVQQQFPSIVDSYAKTK